MEQTREYFPTAVKVEDNVTLLRLEPTVKYEQHNLKVSVWVFTSDRLVPFVHCRDCWYTETESAEKLQTEFTSFETFLPAKGSEVLKTLATRGGNPAACRSPPQQQQKGDSFPLNDSKVHSNNHFYLLYSCKTKYIYLLSDDTLLVWNQAGS